MGSPTTGWTAARRDAGRASRTGERARHRTRVRAGREHGIDCDLRRKPNLTYTESPDERDRVEAEAGAALRAGLPASVVEDTDLPFPVAAAVRFADQAEFHPVHYLHGLARALERGRRLAVRGHLRGRRRRGRALPRRDGARADGDRGRASSSPPTCPSSTGASTSPAVTPSAPTWSPRLTTAIGRARACTSAPSRRRTRSGPMSSASRRWLLVGGESHKTGQGDAAERYERLTAGRASASASSL